MRLWDPSQNGLLFEAPHRHSANGVLGGAITFPSWSLSTTSPLTSVDPFLRMISSTSAMVGVLPPYRPPERDRGLRAMASPPLSAQPILTHDNFLRPRLTVPPGRGLRRCEPPPDQRFRRAED